MDDLHLLFRFAVALVLGALVGLQRELVVEDERKELPAGIRTFALLGLAGVASAMLSDLAGSALPFLGVLAVLGALFAVGHHADAKAGNTGMTTKVASVLTVLAGALCYHNRLPSAVALGVATTFLLSFKIQLHRFAHRVTSEDMIAALQFVLVTAVILPVLPDKSYGPLPFNVLNPFRIWLLVALIAGLSFVGYILVKAAGPRKGIGLTGLLGGLASSTALTVSLTRQSRKNPLFARPFAFALMLAWTVMFLRVLAEVAVVNRPLVRELVVPIVVSVAAGLLYSVILFRIERRKSPQRGVVAFSNPFELGKALQFTAVLTVILVLSKAAQLRFGPAGTRVSAFVLGLADADAAALSVASLTGMAAGADPATASQGVMLAVAANTLLKAAVVTVGGAPPLRKAVLPGFLMMAFGGLVAVFFL